MTTPAPTPHHRGSEWRRWDPHIHAPGTLLSDHFPKTWDGFVDAVNASQPVIEVLGVTDYFCIRTYRQARKLWCEGRMPTVAMLFPNVELRLDLRTEKVQSLNVHLLFAPDDQNHEQEIERVLAHLECEYRGKKWHCTSADLTALGRVVDPKQTDDDAAMAVGANQFKVTLDQLKDLFRTEEWVRRNCLVAVAGGSNDGTSGLKNDGSYKLMREEVESFADIIFAATPSQRVFWLGKSASNDQAAIERTYRFLKPCLHGSDAHHEEKVGTPDLDRLCWIKGDPTFEALRQAVLEPEERVWIAPRPPAHHVPEVALTQVNVANAPWFQPSTLELNPGLVAVIGARGSGKTALVEIIARGAHSAGTGIEESSFLRRASRPKDLLGKASVQLDWRDGVGLEEPLVTDTPVDDDLVPSDVCYLSQQSVDRLCSSDGLARELRDEIERVLFQATDPTERLDTESFDEYASLLLEPIRRRREELQAELQSLSNDILGEQQLHGKLVTLNKQLEEATKKLDQNKKDLAALLPKGAIDRAKTLADLEAAHTAVQAKIEKLKKRRQALDVLVAEVAQVRTTTEVRRLADMKKRHAAAELDTKAWESFGLVFAGNVDTILATTKLAVDREIAVATTGDPAQTCDTSKNPSESWPLVTLREQRDLAKKAVGIDADRQKKYESLRKSIDEQEATVRRLKAEVVRATGADGRMRKLIESRRRVYAAVFSTIVEEEAALARLYESLSKELQEATGAMKRLEFFVRRNVDLDSWVARAERDIFDLRRAGPFRGHGSLKKEIAERLLPSLSEGTADEVANAMDSFRSDRAKHLQAMMPADVPPDQRGKWTQTMATWLYATDHISVEYGIRYDGTMLEQLSPGTRGIVLLLLYLAIDRHDKRPLIIDQPEENLDPKSVFDELVPHFREARRRRQVIVVTHNANLVVNTDADQVIVATATVVKEGALPTISYESGALEDPSIRRSVCEVLEGGERAFLERERRYRLRWGQTLAETAGAVDGRSS